MFSLYTWSLALLWLNESGSLSSDVFERRTSTGSAPFSLFKCLDDTKSVLLSDFTLTETICPLPFDLRCSQTSVLINSLMKKVWQRRSEIRVKTVKTRVLGSSRCHRWVNGATVVVKSETVGINVIFAFSQHWVFHYSIWPIARESHRRSSSLASS